MLKSKIKVMLAEKELKQIHICEQLGMSKQQFNAWVNGRSFPSLDKAFKLAKLLDCKVDDLWEHKEG